MDTRDLLGWATLGGAVWLFVRPAHPPPPTPGNGTPPPPATPPATPPPPSTPLEPAPVAVRFGSATVSPGGSLAVEIPALANQVVDVRGRFNLRDFEMLGWARLDANGRATVPVPLDQAAGLIEITAVRGSTLQAWHPTAAQITVLAPPPPGGPVPAITSVVSPAQVAQGGSYQFAAPALAGKSVDVRATLNGSPFEMRNWARLDAQGRVNVDVANDQTPGVYVWVAIRESGTADWHPTSASITVVASAVLAPPVPVPSTPPTPAPASNTRVLGQSLVPVFRGSVDYTLNWSGVPGSLLNPASYANGLVLLYPVPWSLIRNADGQPVVSGSYVDQYGRPVRSITPAEAAAIEDAAGRVAGNIPVSIGQLGGQWFATF